jgi:predicted phage-related endonuclease
MTGSRVPAVFDAHPFMTAFDAWMDIKGGGRIDTEPNAHMILGQCLESGILEATGRILGCKITPNSKTLRHPALPLVGGTPDGWIDGEDTVVEVKVVGLDRAKDWGFDADEVPVFVVLQLYWYMLLLGFSKGLVAALVGGWLRFYRFTSDPEVQDVMLMRVREWWERYIVGDEQPAMGSSREAAQWLQRMHPAHHPPIREATDAEAQLLDQYVIVRVAEKKLKEQRDTYENLIKQAIGDDEGLRWGGGIGRFTWRKPKDSMVIDYKPMAIGLLQEFVKDPAERQEREDFYTHPKPNVRRIHISHPSLAEAAEAAKEVAA